MDLRDAWERNAADWVRWARKPDHDSYWRFHRERFLDLVPPPGRLTIDVGCGEGRVTRDLKELGHRAVGVDASNERSYGTPFVFGSRCGHCRSPGNWPYAA